MIEFSRSDGPNHGTPDGSGSRWYLYELPDGHPSPFRCLIVSTVDPVRDASIIEDVIGRCGVTPYTFTPQGRVSRLDVAVRDSRWWLLIVAPAAALLITSLALLMGRET